MTPADLRAARGCAGKPPLGTTVKIIDDTGSPVPAGGTARIFVWSGMEFGGYTGGGHKEVVDGLMSTGDVGIFLDQLPPNPSGKVLERELVDRPPHDR